MQNETDKTPYEPSDKEKLEIAIRVIDDLNDNKERFLIYKGLIAQLKSKISLKYKKLSGAIPVPNARKYHQAYLSSPNPIFYNGEILHNLLLDRTGLTKLYPHADGGMRLYIVKEGANISIAIVAVDSDGRNVLSDPGDPTISLIINQLEPCPDVCVTATPPAKNDKSDLNYNPELNGWIKPNLKSPTGTWLVDDKDVIIKS